jgi:hypothetical protein
MMRGSEADIANMLHSCPRVVRRNNPLHGPPTILYRPLMSSAIRSLATLGRLAPTTS